jgi:hypothetical protein
MVLQALAKSNLNTDDEVIGILVEDVVRKAPELDAQGVANTLWALTYLGCGDVADNVVMDALCRRGRGIVQHMNGQETTISLWALAKMGYGVSNFHDDYDDGSSAMVNARVNVNANVNVNVGYDEDHAVWALGLSAHSSVDRFIDALAARAGQESAMLDAQAVSNLLWAFATFGRCPPGHVVQTVSARAREIAHTMSCQCVYNILWSLARLQIRPGAEVLDALCQRLRRLSEQLTPRALVNIMWAFGRFRFRPPQDLLVLIQKRVSTSLLYIHTRVRDVDRS